MKSLLPIFVCILGLCILILIYYIFIYQSPETPWSVFLKLLRNYPDNTLAFTYKRTPDQKYENYYVTDQLDLQKKIEDTPVTFDGLPYINNKNHGQINETLNGFTLTGIEFPFRCPNGWIYENGKCKLPPICTEDDIGFYKGVSFYQFNESFWNPFNEQQTWHPRIYMNCTTNQKQFCNNNELYNGGERISIANGIPCQPYDICQDMLTLTKHNYPIFPGDTLQPNEFYICMNGTSQRRTCPPNTDFSTIQNACIPVTKCFNQPDNTTIPRDSDSFILCRNGAENIVNCRNGVFNVPGQSISCRNQTCLNPRIIWQNFGPWLNLPIGKEYCPHNSNTPTIFTCLQEPLPIVSDDVSFLINTNLPTLEPPRHRFQSFNIPNYILENDNCIPYTLDEEIIHWGTHNTLLPNVPININTLQIQFEEQDEPFYYKDYNVIRLSPHNNIVTTDKKLANFVTTDSLDFIEYVDNVETYTGDSDGVNYLISGTFTLHVRSPTTIYRTPGNTIITQGFVWNAFGNLITTINLAHSLLAMQAFGISDYSPNTYTFMYIIEQRRYLHVITLFAFQTFEIELHPGVDIEEVRENFGHLKVPGLPDYATLTKDVTGPVDRVVVTDIVNQSYDIHHRAYFLNHLNIIKLVAPSNQHTDKYQIEDFFNIDSSQLFKHDTLFNPE